MTSTTLLIERKPVFSRAERNHAGLGPILDAAQDARRVTRAKERFLDAHGQQLFRRLARQVFGGDLDLGQAQRVARQRADFPRDADDAVPIGPVGRDFQIVNHVPSGRPRYSAKGWPTMASVAQDQDSLDVVRQAQFLAASRACRGIRSREFCPL